MFNLFKDLRPFKNLNAHEFQEAILGDSSGIILDVRSAAEMKEGKIKGARNMDVTSRNFQEAVRTLPKERSYYIYCRSGGRSAMACRIMAKEGFKNLYNLSGGLMAWTGLLVK